MPKKSDNYFVRVSKYQKAHPRATREQAMKMVSKEISGVKKKLGAKKKVTGRKTSPKKKTVTRVTRITKVGSHKAKKTTTSLQRSINISKKINDLELVLKHTTGTVEKNKIKRLINAEYDKLDVVTKKLKSA